MLAIIRLELSVVYPDVVYLGAVLLLLSTISSRSNVDQLPITLRTYACSTYQ